MRGQGWLCPPKLTGISFQTPGQQLWVRTMSPPLSQALGIQLRVSCVLESSLSLLLLASKCKLCVQQGNYSTLAFHTWHSDIAMVLYGKESDAYCHRLKQNSCQTWRRWTPGSCHSPSPRAVRPPWGRRRTWGLSCERRLHPSRPALFLFTVNRGRKRLRFTQPDYRPVRGRGRFTQSNV